MIINALMNLIYKILDLAFTPINIPELPGGGSAVIQYIDLILVNAKSIIDFVIPWNLVKTFLPILLIIIFSEDIYKLIMWVLRKIPMLGIE